jgi:hypothetical protein
MDNVLSDIVQSTNAQSISHLRQAQTIRQNESQMTTALQLEVDKLQHDRANLNQVRKHINDVVTDAMKILKQSGDEIRNSAKG